MVGRTGDVSAGVGRGQGEERIIGLLEIAVAFSWRNPLTTRIAGPVWHPFDAVKVSVSDKPRQNGSHQTGAGRV
jgi:hypothetical protein